MTLRRIFTILTLCMLCSCSIACQKSVEENFWQYEPFGKNSKVAHLEGEPTLKLSDNLPKLDGATALYPLYAAFVQAVYPEGIYTPNSYWTGYSPIVNCTRTSSAYYNLISGEADIIFCAKPSDEQIEYAASQGKEFILTPIGREAFVFFVNKHNTISNLTLEEIKGIYTGKITNWSQLGGKNQEIIAFQRNMFSGSQTIFESIMGDENIIEPVQERVLDFMLSMVNEVVDYKNYNNAIGYSFLFYTTEMVKNNQIKLLSINGVEPSKETIINNEYPFSDVFYAVTITNENENVNKFIEWILSEQGQSLIKGTGYVSIN